MVEWSKTGYRVTGVLYMLLMLYYFYIRVTKTMGIYYQGWRWTIFVAEVLSALPFAFQVFMRLRKPWSDQADGQSFEVTEDVSDYIVRILVPCYNEPLEIVRATVMSAINQVHPEGKLFVYLCDDGNHPELRVWATKYDNLTYITRPEKYKGHSKAGNLNYALRHVVYPQVGDTAPENMDEVGKLIPLNEVVGVLDADMIAEPTMARDLLQYFAKDPENMMGVQAPQTFHNVDVRADFFDAHNMGFFHYSLPAMASWNATTCCGTNLLFSARAMVRVGLYPYYSITEDFGMAVALHETIKGKYAYHPYYVATGEAPEDLRQIFQQRSRWAKGNVMVCLKRNFLFNSKLSLVQRLNFFSFGWCYVTSGFINPLFLIMNVMGVMFGVFPVGDLSFDVVTVLMCYYLLYCVLVFWSPQPSKHYLSLWIGTKAGHFFSFMAVKAIIRVIRTTLFPKSNAMLFKVTQKRQVAQQQNYEDNNSPVKEKRLNIARTPVDEKKLKIQVQGRDSSESDINFHWAVMVVILITILYGYYINLFGADIFPEFHDERDAISRKLIRWISVLWVIELSIGYSLPLWYAYLPNDQEIQAFVLKFLCIMDNVVTLVLLVLAMLSASIL